MNLDSKRFKVDELRSNPMVVAMQYPDCPINEICFYLVVGFGSVAERCKDFKENPESETEAECLREKV